jgi:TetR/AcrR family transcriptional repressor of nem operon
MGRPREFDEEAVLFAAIDVFWANGYEATSTRELVRGTGLAQPSLYNTFGDKRSLFRQVLRTYAEWTVRDRISQLEESLSPGCALAKYFDDVIDSALTDRLHRGCLLINTALCTPDTDDDLKQSVVGDIEKIRNFFERCIVVGQKSGELSALVPPQMAADHLFSVLLGVRVQAKMNPDAASLRAAVAAAFGVAGLSAFSSVNV